MRKSVAGTLALLAVVAIPTASLPSARPAPADEAIRTRQAIMAVNERIASLTFNLSTGRIPWNSDVAKAALLQLAGDLENFPSFFPDDTNRAPSNATPAVWTNRAVFAAAAMKMVTDARAAAADATSADALASSKAFLEVQKNCTTCHTQFRKPT